jgi:hypothetical protein
MISQYISNDIVLNFSDNKLKINCINENESIFFNTNIPLEYNNNDNKDINVKINLKLLLRNIRIVKKTDVIYISCGVTSLIIIIESPNRSLKNTIKCEYFDCYNSIDTPKYTDNYGVVNRNDFKLSIKSINKIGTEVNVDVKDNKIIMNCVNKICEKESVIKLVNNEYYSNNYSYKFNNRMFIKLIRFFNLGDKIAIKPFSNMLCFSAGGLECYMKGE